MVFFIPFFLLSQENDKPNILFISIDDLKPSIGSFGDEFAITPNIDKLAKNGVLFGNAHNQYPWCGPSRASFMTGLYPDQTKMKKLRLYLRQAIPEVITIGQKFRQENSYCLIYRVLKGFFDLSC